MKRSKRKALPKSKVGRLLVKLEHLKASVQAKVEHPFQVIKNLPHHRKTRDRSLAKKILFSFPHYLASPIWVLAGRRFVIIESPHTS